MLPRRRGLTYAFLFLSGKKWKSTWQGEEPPEPGSFPLRLKAGLRSSRADKPGSCPGLGRLLSSLASQPCGQGANPWNSGGSLHPPTPHHLATEALLTTHQTCNTSEKWEKKISSSPARGKKV